MNRTLKVVGTTLLLLVCLSPGVQAQDFLTVTWKSELGCIETPIDSVQVTNLTKKWTKTVFFPEQSIKLYTSVGINEVADFASRQILVKPNPFSQTAEVNFYVGKEGMVHVRLYDIFGRTVASLSQQMDCGTQQLLVNAGSSGHYFLSIETPTEKRVAKLLSMGYGNASVRHSELVSESLTYKGIANNTPLPPLKGGIASSTNAAKSPFEGGKGDVLEGAKPQKSDPDLPFSIGDSMQFIAFVTDTNGNNYAYPPQSCKIFADQELLFIYNPLPHVRIAWTAEFNCGYYPLDSVVITSGSTRAVFRYPDTAYIHENMGIFQYGDTLTLQGFIDNKDVFQYKKTHIVTLTQDTLITFAFFNELSFVDTIEMKIRDSIKYGSMGLPLTLCYYNAIPNAPNEPFFGGKFLIINTQSYMDSVFACNTSYVPPTVDFTTQTLILVRGMSPNVISDFQDFFFIKNCSGYYVFELNVRQTSYESIDGFFWMVIVNEVIQSKEQVKIKICYDFYFEAYCY